MPPLSELFAICDYFDVTPSGFFDNNIAHPELIQKALEGLKQLDDSDLLLMLNIINRISKQTALPVRRMNTVVFYKRTDFPLIFLVYIPIDFDGKFIYNSVC